MSSLIVQSNRLTSVAPHPNADRLELAIIGGWQTVVPKGAYKAGDLVTYIPPDCVVPVEHSDRWGVTKYLSNGRVRAARLRGEPSYGFVVPAETGEGEDAAAKLGITKWVPPMKFTAGDAEPTHPLFYEYTDVENMRNFANVFLPGEIVQVTEKIHGANSRIAIIKDPNGDIRVSGSRTMQRRGSADSIYNFPWTIPSVEAAMVRLAELAKINVILFGEVYGKVQSLRYGQPNGLAYAAFDCFVDGRYLSVSEFQTVFADVPRAPVVAEMAPYSIELMAKLSAGNSLVPGADHIREGIVARPMQERIDPKIGRVILKYVSDAYLCGDFDASSE